VRNALVQCQTRKGAKSFAQAILDKYTPGKPHITGSLAQADFAKVIAECATA
jgi:hypothetical protein